MNTEKLSANLFDLIKNLGATESSAHIIRSAIIIVAIFVIAYFANLLTKRIILSIVKKIIKRTKNEYDDIFLEKKVFTRLSHIVPALIIYYSIPLAFKVEVKYSFNYTLLIGAVQSLCYIYMIIAILLVFNSLLDALHEIYQKIAEKKHLTLSINGYIQVVKIIFIIIVIILVFSVLLGKSPGAIFAGLGAMAAILMLVFKDTILGFVASIQLSAYKMLKPGDWISMPSRQADGDVIDISLSTVKVRNFDKTITTIPTYALVSESFTNWDGMQQSGGRRIKRSINIDMSSIKFCTPEMITKFKKIHHLKDYIEAKENEIADWNQEHNIDNSVLVNGRRMTNIGTFRIYLEGYIKSHPKVHNEFTFLIRQLKPTEQGVPIEVYFFTNDTNWGNYEGIQADIFDHIFAVIPEFELKVFQNPSGQDFNKIIH